MSDIKKCIRCESTSHVNYSGRCVNCYRKDNPEIIKKIAERNKRSRFTLSGKFTAAKGQAKERGLPWRLTKDQYAVLNAQSCFYCGGSLPEKGSGLDRMNNDKSIGYTEDNVLPCCTVCNSIRGNKLSITETLAAVSAVKERRIEAVREFFDKGVHVDSRQIMICSDINNETADTVIKGIEVLENINPHACIFMTIMSDGGDWPAALSIYDRMKASSCPIVTIGTGMVASAATSIMQAGIIRLATPNCTFLIHDGTGGFEGDPKSFETWAEASKKDRKLQYEIYAKRSNKTADEWQTLCIQDTFFSGEEIAQVGLIDKIVDYEETPKKIFEQFQYSEEDETVLPETPSEKLSSN